MQTNGFNEQDVVRVITALRGEDPYIGTPVSIPSGEIGTVVLGKPGRDTYDVEFDDGILTVDVQNLEPWQ